MYIRLRPNKSGTTTVYLIDSLRVTGKKHSVNKVVKCFGSSANQDKIDQWLKEAEQLKSELNKHKITSRNFTTIKQDQDISSCQVMELGMKCLYQQIFNAIFDKLNLQGIDKQMLADLVTMRIAMPVSKLRTANISSSFGIDDLTVNKIYKMMDLLDDDKIEKIKKYVWQNTRNLLGDKKIKVMFYDLTTIYFEANSQTELKEFGFSKDGKSQHVQISLALIVTDCGMPIGYEIFKGNKFEGSTLIPTLDKLKQQYKIDNITIVADSAMLSQTNINALIEHRYNFIVAARVKNMTTKLTWQILDDKGYVNVVDHHSNLINFRYKSIALDKARKLITVFSEDKKRKDEYDRNKALQKIQKLAGKNSKTGLRGVLKKSYIKVNKDSIIEIDEAKIAESKKLDGYFGFISNSNLSPTEIIAQYRGLWQVEQSFRITKHNLKIRPVYHYVDRRIKAHFAICYLSLAVIRSLEYKLKMAGNYMPIEELHYYLNQIKEVKLTAGGVESSIVTDIEPKIKQIFIALQLDLPKRYMVKCRV